MGDEQTIKVDEDEFGNTSRLTAFRMGIEWGCLWIELDNLDAGESLDFNCTPGNEDRLAELASVNGFDVDAEVGGEVVKMTFWKKGPREAPTLKLVP